MHIVNIEDLPGAQTFAEPEPPYGYAIETGQTSEFERLGWQAVRASRERRQIFPALGSLARFQEQYGIAEYTLDLVRALHSAIDLAPKHDAAVVDGLSHTHVGDLLQARYRTVIQLGGLTPDRFRLCATPNNSDYDLNYQTVIDERPSDLWAMKISPAGYVLMVCNPELQGAGGSANVTFVEGLPEALTADIQSFR